MAACGDGDLQRQPRAGPRARACPFKPDVILTAGTPGTLAAKQATESIPIFTAIAGEPVAAGLVPSLAKPGGRPRFGSAWMGLRKP